MPLYIQTNVSSMVAQSNLGKTQIALATSFARLSSGFRINSSADDAAGLGISESMIADSSQLKVSSAIRPQTPHTPHEPGTHNCADDGPMRADQSATEGGWNKSQSAVVAHQGLEPRFPT